MPKTSNQIKLESQEKMLRGEILGHLNPAEVKRRYIDEVEPIEALAADLGISVIYLRRYVQAFGMFRDRGAVFRAGTVPKPNKGIRVPGSRRDPARRSRKWSPEHRAKLAKAKTGKLGEESNRWKGGHEVGGYSVISVAGVKIYEHRIIAARLLGRELMTEEHVHHIDQNRRNNCPSNLIVLSAKDHLRLHKWMNRNPGGDQRAFLKSVRCSYEDLINYA